MNKPQTLRTFPLIAVLAAGLILAACGDTPTGPGTAPTAAITSPATTNGVPTTATSTTSAATTAASTTSTATTAAVTTVISPATTVVTTAAARTANPTTAPTTTSATSTTASTTTAVTTAGGTQTGTLDVSKVTATLKPLDFLNKIHDIFLSPDGSLIAALDVQSKQFCFYMVDGQKQTCSAVKGSVDYNSVRWSPDSRYLAYNENFFQYFQDPDIWLVEVASGKATDLTEDNTTKVPLGSSASTEPGGPIDLYPVFTADSKGLYFMRYADTEAIIPQLFKIDLQGGQPVPVTDFEQSNVRFSTYGYAISPDGNHIAYGVSTPTVKEVKNGLWLGNEKAKDTLQLFSSPDLIAARPKSTALFVTDTNFSADGNYLMAQLAVNYNGPEMYDFDNMLVYTLDGKRVEPIDPETPVNWASWSPTGSAMVVFAADGLKNITNKVSKAGIYLLDKPGGKSIELVKGKYIPASMGAIWRSSTWATNNTMLVRSPDGQQVSLLQLDIN